MPAFLKTPQDEKLWQRAKREYAKQNKEPQDRWVDKDWATVTTIWKNMKKHAGSVSTRLQAIASIKGDTQ